MSVCLSFTIPPHNPLVNTLPPFCAVITPLPPSARYPQVSKGIHYIFTHAVLRDRRVLCNGDRFCGMVGPPTPPPPPPPSFGLRKFLVLRDHPPHPPLARKSAGRCRSEVKNFWILLGVLHLENFWLTGPPLPGWEICWVMQIWSKKILNFVRVFGLRKFSVDRTLPPLPAGKFAGRCRSEVKKISILLGVLDWGNFRFSACFQGVRCHTSEIWDGNIFSPTIQKLYSFTSNTVSSVLKQRLWLLQVIESEQVVPLQIWWHW